MKLRPSLLACLLLTTAALAKQGDWQQRLTIQADWQEFTQDGRIQYQGAVQLQQGSLSIQAEQLIVEQVKPEQDRVIATGSPVQYRQQTDKGDWIEATADKLEYDTQQQEVILHNAELRQGRHKISSELITFNTQTQRFTAKRATSIREGSQLEVPTLTPDNASPPDQGSPDDVPQP